MHELARMYSENPEPGDYAAAYLRRLRGVLEKVDTTAVAAIIEALDETARNGKTLYFLANGGSAAVASHFVNDLVAGAYMAGAPPFRAFCLCDNVESLTAIANDDSYENVFVNQLRCGLQPGDLVYAMSVSGNSENVLRAVHYARENGARTVGLCGLDGGRLRRACDIVLHVPTSPDEYGPVEDVFAIMDHIVTGYLAMRRGRMLHHAAPAGEA